MGVQLAAARLPVRAPSLVAQHADALVLLLLGVPTAAIDWQIAVTWALPAWVAPAGVCLVAALIVMMLIKPGAKSFAIAAVVAVLYALPVVGAIVRWHLVASPRALIGDGAYQTQLAGDFVLHGIDPYGADYGRAGLAAAPWGESFPSPALHHLVTWPGQFLLPLPLQAISRSVFGWWDERVFLLVAAVAIWLLLGALFPGTPGRMAAVAFFLVPGHSLLAVLGDNDLPVLALLLAALLAAQHRRFLLMGLLLGCAIATKQHALLAVPLIVAFAKENDVPYPCVIGDEKTQGQVADFQGFPTTLFLDRSGKVRTTLVGFDPEIGASVMEEIVKTLLAEHPPKTAVAP